MISRNLLHTLTPFIFIFILLLSFTNAAYSAQIIRLNIEYDDNLDGTPTPHYMDIELFPNDAPKTVENFLDYVSTIDTDGLPKYNDTFIYRSVPGFVLQTGGYTFRPPDPLVDALIDPAVVNPPGLSPVIAGIFSPVINEPGISNTRGTIAMAKVPDQPDSASNEWYINLVDNSKLLDNTNGGFTVFGKIVDDGVEIADEISTYPIRPFADLVLGSAFSNLPVVNYDINALPAVLKHHLVMISTIDSAISRPVLRFNNDTADFILDTIDGVSEQLAIELNNTGNEQLTIENVQVADISAPFSILSNNCTTNSILHVPTSPSYNSCTIVFEFNPLTLGIHNDSLNISYRSNVNSTSYNVTYHLTGTGVPITPVLDAFDVTIVDFGDIKTNTSSIKPVSIRNKGGDILTLDSFEISGPDKDDFHLDIGDCSTGLELEIEEFCTINIEFLSASIGEKNASVSISSTDSQTISISLTGIATQPEISVQSTLDFGQVQITEAGSSKSIFVTNIGGANLTLTDISFTGSDSIYFSQINNCPDTNNTIFPTVTLDKNDRCEIIIEFTPVIAGLFSTDLTIKSDDPLNPLVSVNITGTGTFEDTDGIDSVIEDSAPNNGDGNNDGLMDSTQNNVASYQVASNNYITMISDNSQIADKVTSINGIELLDVNSIDIPGDLNLIFGTSKYKIILPVGDYVQVGLLLPLGTVPNTYKRYGPTPDNIIPHWYDFSYDESTATGATFIGNVTINQSSGASIERNMIILNFKDGARGDDDLVRNGEISHLQGGVSGSFSAPDNGGSGSVNVIYLLLVLLNLYARTYYKKRIIALSN